MNMKQLMKGMINCINKRIAIDLDGTLTTEGSVKDFENKTPNQVKEELMAMKPDQEMIDIVNALHENGNLIYIYTARNDIYQEVTANWLKKHGVSYEYIVVNKEYYDYFVDDKAINPIAIKEIVKEKERA